MRVVLLPTLLLKGGPGAASAAEEQFERSLDWTRAKGTLPMERRSATGLARLWHHLAKALPRTFE